VKLPCAAAGSVIQFARRFRRPPSRLYQRRGAILRLHDAEGARSQGRRTALRHRHREWNHPVAALRAV